MDQEYRTASFCFNDTFNLTVYSQIFMCSKLEFNISTCLPIQTTEEIDTIKILCEAADVIWIIGFWFSVISGILGNGLAILTIASLPTSTATFFVGLLAVSDMIGVCIQVVVQLLDKYRMYSRVTTSWELSVMLYDTSASYSNWLLVLICLERYFTVRFPLHKRYYFTLTHAKASAFVLAIFIVVIYNTVTWTVGYNNLKMYKIRNLFYAGLPLALILVIIGLISYQLRRIHRDRQSLNCRVHSRMGLSSMDDQQSTKMDRNGNTSSLQEIARLENSITIMMLVAAICFSLLTIPYCVLLYTYLDSALTWNTPLLRARWHLFMKISQVLVFLNLSVNFLLYFLSAKKFRTQLFKVIFTRYWCLTRHQHNKSQQLNNSSKADSSQHALDADYLTFRLVTDSSPIHTEQNNSSDSVTHGIPLPSLMEGTTLNGHSPVEAASKEIYESYPALRSDLCANFGSRV